MDSELLEGGSAGSEEQVAPKDLSVRARRPKLVPPPLDLRLGVVPEVDSFRLQQPPPPSPLSPAGQKALPFRKRAHSLSGQEPTSSPAPFSPQSAGIKEEAPVGGRGPFSVERLLGPPSALLSPSSLGSSQEELCSPLWAHQTPLGPRPLWHCFGAGSRVRLGASWQAVEELGATWHPEWPLQVSFYAGILMKSVVLFFFIENTMLYVIASATMYVQDLFPYTQMQSFIHSCA